MTKFLTSVKALLCVLLLSGSSFAGTVTGQVQTPSGGGFANATFSFTLTQPALVSGTATIAPATVNCYTDANGNVVGEPNPLVIPAVSANLASGTLGAATYFVKLAYIDATGLSAASPEATLILSSTGTLVVTAPTRQPNGATGYNVYISTSTGTETLQGSVTGTPGQWANFSQASALGAGAALPGSNTTSCKMRFNDELQPSFVCYDVGLISSSGSTLPGYPQYWYLSGGTSGTVNIGIGTPQSTVCQGSGVSYPQSIVAVPIAGATQSIGGGLDLGTNPFKAGPFTIGGIVGPNPWYDVTVNGLTCDGNPLHDDTTAFNGLTSSACAAGGGTLFIPAAHTCTFNSAPNPMHCGLNIVGSYSKGSTFSWGSFIKCNYTESTATNGCLTWDGANESTQGNGGSITGVNLQKGDGFTGGVAIKLGSTSCTARSGDFNATAIKISASTGTWSYGAYVDGSGCTGAGTQGSRDNYFSDFFTFDTTVEAIHFDNCTHCGLNHVVTSPGTGVGDITITGASATSTTQSTDVYITGGSIAGNLNILNANNVRAAAHSVSGTVTMGTNSSLNFWEGVTPNSPSILGSNNGFQTIDPNAAASFHAVNLIPNTRSNGFIVAGSIIPNNAGAGDVLAGHDLVIGSNIDGNNRWRRNNGSGSNTNDCLTFDSGNTCLWNFDSTLGFSTTLNGSWGGLFTKYNNISTVGNGVPAEIAASDQTGLTANTGPTTVYTVAASQSGFYRINTSIFVTTVAGTTSNLPDLKITYTHPDSSTAESTAVFAGSGGNALTTGNNASFAIYAKAGTTIQFQTGSASAYASNPATTMQYSLHIKVEALQ